MATRSRIGLQASDGTIISIYCHNDGYPEGVGATLRRHYTDPTKVAALIALGDISSLGEEVGEKHDFNSRDPRHAQMTTAYGRDRGEQDTDALSSDTLLHFRQRAEGSDAEFVYLFTDGRWTYCEGSDGDFMPLGGAQ